MLDFRGTELKSSIKIDKRIKKLPSSIHKVDKIKKLTQSDQKNQGDVVLDRGDGVGADC